MRSSRRRLSLMGWATIGGESDFRQREHQFRAQGNGEKVQHRGTEITEGSRRKAKGQRTCIGESRSITFTPSERSQSRPPWKLRLSPATTVPKPNCRISPLQYEHGARVVTIMSWR